MLKLLLIGCYSCKTPEGANSNPNCPVSTFNGDGWGRLREETHGSFRRMEMRRCNEAAGPPGGRKERAIDNHASWNLS